MKNISSQFTGKYLALIDEEIMAVGSSYLEVYQKAKRVNPEKMISLNYFPTKKENETWITPFDIHLRKKPLQK